MAKENEKVRKWIESVSNKDIPIFAHTARILASVGSDSDRSASQIAEITLMDSSLTTKVLRMANSVSFNPGGVKVNTVSRAIVLLGIETIRQISLTVSMVDSTLKGHAHESAVREMAQGLYAALFARSVAENHGAGDIEAMYIAALLDRIGHLTFWCNANGDGERLIEAYGRQGVQAADAEREVLGFTLTELGKGLIESWNIEGVVVTDQLSNGRLLLDFARQVVSQSDTSQILASDSASTVCDAFSISKKDMRAMIESCREETRTVLSRLGANRAALVLDPSYQDAESDERQEMEVGQLRWSILSEMVGFLGDSQHIQTVIAMAIEGLRRVSGTHLSALFVYNLKADSLAPKQWQSDARIWTVDDLSGYFGVSESQVIAWMKSKDHVLSSLDAEESLSKQMATSVLGATQVQAFCLQPIKVGDKFKAILYCDWVEVSNDCCNEVIQMISTYAKVIEKALALRVVSSH